MISECIILADGPGTLIELCGISTLERLLRTLQRCGIERATVLSSTPKAIAQELAAPSWARAQLHVTLRARPDGAVTIEQIVDNWPDNRSETPLLLIVPGHSVFDPRLLRALVAQDSPAALVDSGLEPRIQALGASAPDTARGKLCGPALLENDWASARSGSFEHVLRSGLEDHSLPAMDVSAQPLYYVSMCRKLRQFWFPVPSLSNRKLAERVLLDSIQKGPPDIPAWVHAPIETFLVSHLCKTPITPNQLTLFCNVVAWTVTILLVTGQLAWGLGLALIVGVLDGLDGKLARLKLETSKAGKLEHLFDALFENSWWLALAWHLSVSGKLPDAFSYLALLIGAEITNALARASIVRYYGKSITELASFDRIFRLVGGRRNIYVWILALGLILGTVTGAFKLIAWWEAVTAAIQLARAAWALWALRSQSGPR
ncbi:MAG TPA: CDP-alcohol phosphatidyltransferase family protein [Candidatus Udaeobacter sp.]|nr:CDP-alcohol phosphatidyltransferase family protein [Candidatus Udaeobacter sp.]